MPNDNQRAELEAEAEAFAEFAAEKAGTPKKRPDRAEARRIAQEAASAARTFLAEPPPKLAEPEMVPVEAVPAPAGTDTCGCGVVLGHAIYGVHTNGHWYCPTCFMREARSHDLHPVARAVECPTCHRKSVDFTGRNQCPVCRARGARPIRMN